MTSGGHEVDMGDVKSSVYSAGPSLVPRPFYKTDLRGRVWANDLSFGVAEHCIPL